MAAYSPNGRMSGLGTRDLDNVLRVLESCERASSVGEFRFAALDSMARYLGYRNTGFFIGASLELCFDDPSTLVNGPVARLAPQFLERYHHDDIFAQPPAISLLEQHQVATLDQLPRPTRPNLRDYVENFLLRNGIRAEMVLHIRSTGSLTALISAVDSESGAFDARDLAIAEILGRHLGNLLRWHAGEIVETSCISVGLSERQIEVVALLACGLTNVAIAKKLCITPDTVKKHVTRALQISGCRNRTELAVAWRSRPELIAEPETPQP